MTKSKRLLVLIVSFITFVIGLAFKFEPISLATGLTILTAPYIGAETIRKSDKKNSVK